MEEYSKHLDSLEDSAEEPVDSSMANPSDLDHSDMQQDGLSGTNRHHRQTSDNSKLNDIRRSGIYRKLSKAIIPPLQSSLSYISSNPVFPFDENAIINELIGLELPDSSEKHEESPKDELPPNEEDIDIALPLGEQKPLNYFLNMLASALMSAGLSNLSLKHILSMKDEDKIDNALTPDEQKPTKDPLAYGVFESDSDESPSEDDPDEPEEQDDIQPDSPQTPSSPKSVADQTFYDAIPSVSSPQVHVDNGEGNKLLESLTLKNKDLDQLYQEEIKSEQSSIKSRKDSLKSKSTTVYPTTSAKSATAASSRPSISETVHDTSTGRTRFQQSVVDNLNPHVVKEGLLVKLKNKASSEDENSRSKEDNEKKEGLLLKIADRLKQVFELDDEDVFYANYQSWLIKDVLLLGHLYLTKDAILFFAFLPKHAGASFTEQSDSLNYSDQDDSSVMIHSGTLGMKRAQYGDSYFSSVMTHRFWAILRPDTLSIYRSTTDLYFPMLVIDLKLALRAEIIDNEPFISPISPGNNLTIPKVASRHNSFENRSPRPTLRPSGFSVDSISADDDSDVSSTLTQDAEESQESVTSGVWFKLVTKKKTYKFHTDNQFAARQWVNSLTKLIFQLQNSNSRNEVLIKIPISNIIGFKKTDILALQGDDKDLNENERPLSFGIQYFEEDENSGLSAKRMKKKLDDQKSKYRQKKHTNNILDDEESHILQSAEDKSHINVKNLYFLFFRDTDEFFNIFNQVIYDHNAEKTTATSTDDVASVNDSFLNRAKQMVRSRDSLSSASSTATTATRPISTLSNYSSSRNTIVDQLIALNERLNNYQRLIENPFSQYQLDVTPSSIKSTSSITGSLKSDDDSKKSCAIENGLASITSSQSQSRFKKIGKGLTSKAKLFTKPSRSLLNQSQPTSSVSSTHDVSVFTPGSEKVGMDFEHVENDTSNPSTPNFIHLPRTFSVNAIKGLNMSFETSQRDVEVAESRYNEVKEYIDSHTPTDYDPEESKANSLEPQSSQKIMEPQIFITPLNLTDPSEYKQENTKKKKTPLKNIGKNLKSLSMGNMWNSQPNHYEPTLDDDPYFVEDLNSREVAQSHFQEHFSLNNDKMLVASYYAHLQRALPVYGKVYLGTDQICFRSLLPGVSTKMILPIEAVENCLKEKGLKLTYSGLVIVVRGHDDLFLEFSSSKARDDCEAMILGQLENFHKDEPWEPKAHEWGVNYDYGLELTRLDNPEFNNAPASSKLENSRIENARIKLFEDKLKSAAGLDIPIILEDSPFFKTEIKPTTSFNFTLLTIGSRGDVQPYIALSKGLMAEGHNVTIATHKEFEPWILLHGIKFKEIAGNPAELMQLMVQHGSMSVAFLKEASSKFRGWISDLLASSWEACQGTDILIESPSAMGGIHIAEALGIPYMRAFTMPWTRTRAYPHAFIVPDQKKGGSYNYLTHVMFENIFWKGISSQVNKWRVEDLNLPRTNLFKLQQSKIPFLYNISPTIFPASVDFPDWVRVTGYWFLDEGHAEDYDAPQELIDFIDAANRDKKKIVYIGFGSIVVSDSKSLTKAVIDAVLQADVRCILNKGWSDRLHDKKNDEVELPLPKEIYNSGSIPHDWLFPRIHAAVHHGGSGTTGATLRFGLPTVIKPFFGDQFFYASRIEEIGVGVALKNLNAKSLAKALVTVTLDLKMIDRAKSASERLRQENGVLAAVETIYSELEYARNLILSKQQQNDLSRNNDHRSSGTQTPLVGAQTPIVYEHSSQEDVMDSGEEDDDVSMDYDDSLKSSSSEATKNTANDNETKET